MAGGDEEFAPGQIKNTLARLHLAEHATQKSREWIGAESRRQVRTVIGESCSNGGAKRVPCGFTWHTRSC